MEHHAHANEPALDPDYRVASLGRNNWEFSQNRILSRQPASKEDDVYGDALVRISKSKVIIDVLVFGAIYTAVLFTMAWTVTPSRRHCYGGYQDKLR